ncbi:hypothetical protein [Halocatena halophila]|uniref:hypothetical protein n=1 Tax=Halocatena halophila TaxID=2814576 RepID=UPI002ECFB71E
MSDGLVVEPEGHTERDRHCTNCDRGFVPQQAHRIERQETTATYTCPWCKQTVVADPPREPVERPPSIVTHSIVTDEDGHSIARLFFEGGSWLQFSETGDGWVREEMFDADGVKIESFAADFNRDACDTPEAYLHQEIVRYDTYTVAGLKIQRPHVATVLLKQA